MPSLGAHHLSGPQQLFTKCKQGQPECITTDLRLAPKRQGTHQPAERAPREGKGGHEEADKDYEDVPGNHRDGAASEGGACECGRAALHHKHDDTGGVEQRLAPKSAATQTTVRSARLGGCCRAIDGFRTARPREAQLFRKL